MENLQLKQTANEIRHGILNSIFHAKSGHPGGSLSAADILTYLYFEELSIDPKNPQDPARDRFVLSKGHAAPALYAALAERGYFPKEDLSTLRQIGSHLQGHPDINHTIGIDMSTGSLGQGFSAAVGMAAAAQMYGDDYRVYALCGDGELQEGQIWEAAMLAGHRELDNLVLIVDNNGLQIDGDIMEVCSPYPIRDKFAAFHFYTLEADGHDFDELRKAFQKAKTLKGKPTVIIADTVKGKAVSFMEHQAGWHGVAPDEEQYKTAKDELKRVGDRLCQN
ncbi:transketolase [Clostridia bacterium]|nr:transketolase [Clostridia bacterium]